MTTITKSFFDKDILDREISAYTLQDGEYSAVILDRGGIIKNLFVPDKHGNITDVVLGYDNAKGYDTNDGYLGALIGRFGNRIDKGKVCLDGKNCQLYCNDKSNHLHGGKNGFDKKIWSAEIIKASNGNQRLILTAFSPDGEENYPGNLNVKVTYSLENGTLTIDYEAVSDKTTLINLTNHAYFNLDGSKDVLDHLMAMSAPYILPTDSELIPRGEFKATMGTPFDFSKEKTFGEGDAFRNEDPDLAYGQGFDHCFVFDKARDMGMPYAVVRSEKSGIVMKCYTDMPAVHLYCGNFLNQTGKQGKKYGRCAGFCLETEALPNNPNVPAYEKYGSSVYKAGEIYRFSAKYAFK